MNEIPKKSLGQHWLKDEVILAKICQEAKLTKNDTVLEIGPGQGTLTKNLLQQVGQVIAVELDHYLAKNLQKNILHNNYSNSKASPWNRLKVVEGDILKFDLSTLPQNYKIVANIPYYLTSHLFRLLGETSNPPSSATILVQKEVAERICASPGQMSILSVSIQLYFECSLGLVVPAFHFEPPPKVDSQVVNLVKRSKPLFEITDTKLFFRLVKAGFSSKRKKLRSSFSGGLAIDKSKAEELIHSASIDPNLRAQNLSLQDWHSLYQAYAKILT